MRSAILFLSVCALCGCRLGESAGYALTRSGEQGDAGGPNGPVAGSGGVPGGSGGASGSPNPTSGTGGTAGAADSGAGASGAGGSGGAGSAPAEPDASVSDDAGTSCSPEVLFCNPVTNEGCPDPMQCAVDLASDVLAGYCIFNGPIAAGCFNSGVTESCPPTQTCFDFECRTLCLCDDDCSAGQCCVDPVGSAGFKVCGDC